MRGSTRCPMPRANGAAPAPKPSTAKPSPSAPTGPSRLGRASDAGHRVADPVVEREPLRAASRLAPFWLLSAVPARWLPFSSGRCGACCPRRCLTAWEVCNWSRRRGYWASGDSTVSSSSRLVRHLNISPHDTRARGRSTPAGTISSGVVPRIGDHDPGISRTSHHGKQLGVKLWTDGSFGKELAKTAWVDRPL